MTGEMQQIHLSGLFSRTTRLMQVALDRRLARQGVSFSQCVVLTHLWQAGKRPVNQSVLAQELEMERSSMSTLLDSLERARLLTREPDLSDGRRWLVRLTARGRALEGAVAQAVEEAEDDLLSGMSAADRAHLRRLMEQALSSARRMRQDVAAQSAAG